MSLTDQASVFYDQLCARKEFENTYVPCGSNIKATRMGSEVFMSGIKRSSLRSQINLRAVP